MEVMDMHMDLDPKLIQKFNCLGTTDKNVLISKIGFQLSMASCACFLDEISWNLQAASGAYYDKHQCALYGLR